MEQQGQVLIADPIADLPIASEYYPREEDLVDVIPALDQEAKPEIIEMYNEINEQLKETVYAPKLWVNEKLEQLKAESTLNMITYVVPESIKVTENTIAFNVVTQDNANAIMQLQFFQDGIIKCHCINPANPSKFSFELVDKPANLTPLTIAEQVIFNTENFEVKVAGSNTKVVVSHNPFDIAVISTKDNIQEALFNMNANNSLKFDENLCADFTFHTEYLYGLAEHAYNLLLEDTRRDKPYRFFNQDICAYPVGSKNGIYGAVPLIVSRKKNSPTFVSLYWQNASDTYIDIHKVEATSNTFWLSERGNLECYIFVNDSARTHFKAMANVFGHCAMPQFFALGYHQSRYSYNDQKDVLGVNEGFNSHEIPCDSITLDIDHSDGCRYFTWNEELFPDPKGMQEILVSDNRQLVTICDPHIKVDDEYHVYKEAKEQDLYVKNKDSEIFVGKCWPGDSIYFDYLNEEARNNWASQYSYEKYKHSTPNLWAWNDMNEPAVFELPGLAMPLDNLHTYKSLADPDNTFQVEHREVHNIYGYTMVKGTYDGLIKRNKCQNIRPHVLSRSFFAGSQKYTAIWTGDTRATWPYLKTTVPMLLSLSLSGISFCGGDVGGFIGDPEPELAVRWYQLGTFMPYFRGHSEINCKRREPWLYAPVYFNPIKESIKDRYKLLPYLYTCFEEHSRTATPIMRPIWFNEDKIADASTMFEQERFMLGEGMLIVPILESGKNHIKGFLNGLSGRWYDFYSKKEMFGDEEIRTGLDRIGCFVKGGNIIPLFHTKNHTKSSKDAKECNINLFVALDEEQKSKGSMYFDDGETFNFQKGEYMRRTIKFDKDTLTWEGEEGYQVDNRVTKIMITGLDAKFNEAYLCLGANTRQKIQLVKCNGYTLLEFVALANKNWRIVLN